MQGRSLASRYHLAWRVKSRPAFASCNGNAPAGIGRWPTGGLACLARFQPVARSLRLAAWTRALPVNKGIIYHDRKNFNCRKKILCSPAIMIADQPLHLV